MYDKSLYFIENKMNATTGKREVITNLETLTDLANCLQNNPGVFILKLGADNNQIITFFRKCYDKAGTMA